jgi:hypothetical protein
LFDIVNKSIGGTSARLRPRDPALAPAAGLADYSATCGMAIFRGMSAAASLKRLGKKEIFVPDADLSSAA